MPQTGPCGGKVRVKEEDFPAVMLKCWECDKLGDYAKVNRSSKMEVKLNKEETTNAKAEEIFHLKLNTLAKRRETRPRFCCTWCLTRTPW